MELVRYDGCGTFCNMCRFIPALAFYWFFPPGNSPAKWNLGPVSTMPWPIIFQSGKLKSSLNYPDLTYKQSRLSQYPNASFGINSSVNSGNNQDPTTFSRVTETYLSAGMQLQSSADIFQFFSKRNSIAANQWEWMAAKANVDKIKMISPWCGQCLPAGIIVSRAENITGVQLQQTQSQLEMTRKMVRAGTCRLNAHNWKLTGIRRSNYISAKGNVTASMLNLKSLMNLDAAAAFDIETPPVELIPVEPIADLQPDFRLYAGVNKPTSAKEMSSG